MNHQLTETLLNKWSNNAAYDGNNVEIRLLASRGVCWNANPYMAASPTSWLCYMPACKRRYHYYHLHMLSHWRQKLQDNHLSFLGSHQQQQQQWLDLSSVFYIYSSSDVCGPNEDIPPELPRILHVLCIAKLVMRNTLTPDVAAIAGGCGWSFRPW